MIKKIILEAILCKFFQWKTEPFQTYKTSVKIWLRKNISILKGLTTLIIWLNLKIDLQFWKALNNFRWFSAQNLFSTFQDVIRKVTISVSMLEIAKISTSNAFCGKLFEPGTFSSTPTHSIEKNIKWFRVFWKFLLLWNKSFY